METPRVTKELLREEEVSTGINVIIDDRWMATFPMESRAQVNLLIEAVNRAHQQRLDAVDGLDRPRSRL